MTNEIKREWSVWVGGGEVNDTYLTKDEALALASQWKLEGYDDVGIMNYKTREEL